MQAGIVGIYAESHPLFAEIPIEMIQGQAKVFGQEHTLPSVGFRAINGTYTANEGQVERVTDPLAIMGGKLTIDRFLTATGGEGLAASRIRMQLKNGAHYFAHSAIKGDQATSASQFNGLQARATSSTQKLANGATANGTPLSLAKLDSAISNVMDPTHIFMSVAMRDRMSAAMRSPTISGNINMTTDQFGKSVMTYNGLKIIAIGGAAHAYDTLPFTEAASSGTSTATSVYVVSVGLDGFHAIAHSMPTVRALADTGETDNWMLDWYVGTCLERPNAVCRLWTISDAAVTA